MNHQRDRCPQGVMRVFEEDAEEQFDSRAFGANCDRLCHNNPTICTVDAVSNAHIVTEGKSFWHGYGNTMGKALLKNNVVNRLCLDPLAFFPEDNQYYESKKEAAKEAAPMLEYLKTSTALRSILLDVEDADEPAYMDESRPSLEGLILLAIAQNPNVTSFTSRTDLPQREFVQFLMSNTVAVQSCRLEKFAMSSFGDATELSCAFEANKSIRRLFMTCHEDSLEHLEYIVRRLDARRGSSEPTGIDVKVTVEVSDPTLRHSHLLTLTLLNDLMQSTRVLKALVLHHVNIDEEKAALLCNGLELNQSMTKLSFINCHFSREAALEFVALTQTKLNRGTNKLKKLHFNCWYANTSPTFVPMLFGSALHTLELGQYYDNFQMLFELLVLHDSNIRLRRLLLIRRLQPPSDLVPLSRYLAHTSTLQGLRIVWSQPHRDLPVLVPPFRANGSLLHVSILDEGKQSNPLSFRSFCTRNASLAILLRAYGGDKDSNGERNGERGAAVGTPPLSLAPSLLAVAQQTPRVAANRILTGLLALSDSLGIAFSVDKLRMHH
jgi:hypothetical protein